MALYANDVNNKLNRTKAKLFAKEIVPLIQKEIEDMNSDASQSNKRRKTQDLLKYFYYFLGVHFSMNLGGDNQTARGIEYFEKSIELGYFTALCNLGICHIKGNGVPKDEKKGFDCFHRSAARGYAGGQHNLAICYEKGIGVQKNPYEALKYERMSAEQGFLNAIYHLATYYENGFGLADDIQTTPDDPTALESMVSESDRKRANMEEAIRLYQMAAELGHEQAQFIIASYYEKGKSSLLPANPVEAFRWYLVCAEKGNPLAQYKLSYFYEHGIGCQINENEAFRWCVKSAELNDFVSQNILGTYYEKGIGCEINYQEAVFWYRRSAEQGYSNAQYNLGRCLLKGIGVPYKDAAEGLRWHRLCANQGEYMAEKSLYHCYKHGIGCDPDEGEAKKWYKRVKMQKERIESAGKQLSLRDTYVSRRQSLDEAILQQHQTMLLGGHQEDANNEPIPPPPVATPITPSPNNRRRTSSADLITSNSKASSSSLITTTAQGKVFRRKNINDNKEYAIKFIPTLLFTYQARSGAMMPITSLKKQKRRRSSAGNLSSKDNNNANANASSKEAAGKVNMSSIPQQSHYLKDENFYTSSFHELQSELDALTQLNHPHVTRAHQNYFQKVHAERYYCVVFELVDYQGVSGNTLKRKMKMLNSIHYNVKCLWLKQCLDALTYLHERHIYHLNLSPDCIYFVTDHFLKITDITLKNLLFVPSSPSPDQLNEPETPATTTTTTAEQPRAQEKKIFQLPLIPSLLMKKVVHYQKSHCYLSFEKISLFMSPDKKHAQNQVNPKALAPVPAPVHAQLTPVPPATNPSAENSASPQLTSSGRNRAFSKDAGRETSSGYSLPPTIVIPPENTSFHANPSPAMIPIEREFYRSSPSAGGAQSPFLPNVKTLAAYGESDLLDGARDDFWTLGCLFAEVLLGQRLKDLVATSFELFHINEEHAQRKETLLVKCFEKEKEVRISYESINSNSNIAKATSSSQLASLSVPSSPMAPAQQLPSPGDAPESAKKGSPPKLPGGGGEMISYGLLNHFIENAWKYSTERMTLRTYFLHYFLPHFQENPFLMELNQLDQPSADDDHHHHRHRRPSPQPVAPQNSLNISALPTLQSQSGSPRARAGSSAQKILGQNSTSQANLAASASQTSIQMDGEGYFIINEDQEVVPVRSTVHGGDGGSRGRRPSYYEDEKHHITSDMMSEIYEYIRLNKMKLKKLERLAYKKSSMIAKGFLMTLFLSDPIYYNFDKAIELSQELIPWLREKEEQMSQVFLGGGAAGGEDGESERIDENVEYVMFFLGIYYAFKLYQYEPAYLDKVNQERFAVDTRENHLQGSSSVRIIRSISGESFGARGNRRSISGESKEERRLRFSSDESRVPFSPTTVLQMNDITLEEEKALAAAKSSNRSSPGAALGNNSRRATPSSQQDTDQAAVPFFMQSIEQGYLVAQNNIGVCYALGTGVPRDYDEAVKWFHMSAHDGNELGQYNLATCFEKGFGVRIDKQEAFRLFTLSADQGCALARCKLGECYEFGIGVTRSYSEAMRWYKLSADQGNAKGQFHLGQFYEKGKGCNVDNEMAVKWYRLAAEQGYNVAQYTLALCYENGVGVEKDPREAQKWYEQNLVEKPFYPIHQLFVM